MRGFVERLFRIQVIRFGMVSTVATIADCGTLMLARHALPETRMFLYLAIALGYVAGIGTHFFLARRYVFPPSHLSATSEAMSVFAVGVVGLGLTEAITVYLSEHVHWRLILAKAMAIGVVFFWNFLARKCLIYRAHPAVDTASS